MKKIRKPLTPVPFTEIDAPELPKIRQAYERNFSFSALASAVKRLKANRAIVISRGFIQHKVLTAKLNYFVGPLKPLRLTIRTDEANDRYLIMRKEI